MVSVWQLLKELSIQFPYHPVILLLGVYPRELKIHVCMNTWMIIAALVTIAPKCKQPRCPSADEWINTMWSGHTMGYSVQFSCLVMSDSLWPHESKHARPPCPSPTPGVHPDSCPLTQWCHPAISSSIVPFSSCPQSLPASVFSNESTLRMRWPKYWSFSFSIIPSKEIPGLISFRMDWLDLLAVQGTLKSLLQHHSSKASILQRSAFFTVQLSHPYMTTGKSIALTRWTFVSYSIF